MVASFWNYGIQMKAERARYLRLKKSSVLDLETFEELV